MKVDFLRRVRSAIDNTFLQEALGKGPENWSREWSRRLEELANGAELRDRAQKIRQKVIENLDVYVDQFTARLIENGINVHHVSDAESACAAVMRIARAHNAKVITKSKSMVTEEIGLNHAMSDAGLHPVETDLGEFIIQLRAETPAHIVAPAIHLRREDVAATFSDNLGMTYTTNIEQMTAFARSVLREKFLTSDIGISGVNFGVAETGTLCLVTNEGNGRMVTTVPPIHIAIMGLERLVPTLGDLALMLRLLPRAATGQKISTYVTLMQAPRWEDDPDGPEERHLILVDNGRKNIARSPMSEILHCIRCGACLNICPVYRKIGGHAYNSPYSGPIGAVVSPCLFGLSQYGHLAKASTLCGACRDICPVNIDLPRYLLWIREKYVREVTSHRPRNLIFSVYSRILLNPKRYSSAQRLMARLLGLLPHKQGWLPWAPPPLSSWTKARHFPPFAAHSFRDQLNNLVLESSSRAVEVKPGGRSVPEEAKKTQEPKKAPLKEFSKNLAAIGGECIECSREAVAEKIWEYLDKLPRRTLIAWGEGDAFMIDIIRRLKETGCEFVDSYVPRGIERPRRDSISMIATADVGITAASAGLADTGTLILPSGRDRPQLASLLPPIHVAILSADAIYPTMEAWLGDGGEQLIRTTSCLTLISGPSKTGDIESTLTIGVHGPARVLVFCVCQT